MMNRKTLNKEPHYSPTKLFLEAKINSLNPYQGKFVPFSQQRDGMGRLIKPKKMQQFTNKQKIRKQSQDSDLPKLDHCLTPETCMTLTDRVDMMEDQIIRSFLFRDPREIKLYEGNSVRIRKNSCPFDLKETYGILSRFHEPQQKIQINIEEKVDRQRKKSFENAQLTKKISNSCKSLPAITENPTSNRLEQTSMKNKSQKKSSSKERNMKQSFYLSKSVPKLVPLPPKANLLQVPIQSLESYKRWPKLNDNIEKNNELFISKVYQTKKLAYQVKQSLRDLEDNM